MGAAIRVKNLTYTYPGANEAALNDVSLKAQPNEVLGVLGPSGCGKSTLLLALSGLIPHSVAGDMAGRVLLNGESTRELSMADLSQTAQLLFQNPESQLFALNVEDEVTFGLENLAKPWAEIERRRDEALQNMDIEDIRRKSLEELSTGQKQRVALAAILTMEPDVYLFDEPTANLDEATTEHLQDTIVDLGHDHAVVVVEHDVAFLKRVADTFLVMNDGEVVASGNPESVLSSDAYEDVLLPVDDTEPDLDAHKDSENEDLLVLDDVSFSYADDSETLHGVDLTVGDGDFIGVVGANGSGKSTLAKLIVGLLDGTGTIWFDGDDITDWAVDRITKRIGYVFQDPDYQLFADTVADEVRFGPRNLGVDDAVVDERVETVLDTLGLLPYKDRDPHALSVGQKRRVSIASVLAMQPEMLIVDEPDTGLDNKTAASMMDYLASLNEAGTTIMVISHNHRLIHGYCDRVIGVKDGRITNPQQALEAL